MNIHSFKKNKRDNTNLKKRFCANQSTLEDGMISQFLVQRNSLSAYNDSLIKLFEFTMT